MFKVKAISLVEKLIYGEKYFLSDIKVSPIIFGEKKS